MDYQQKYHLFSGDPVWAYQGESFNTLTDFTID